MSAWVSLGGVARPPWMQALAATPSLPWQAAWLLLPSHQGMMMMMGGALGQDTWH